MFTNLLKWAAYGLAPVACCWLLSGCSAYMHQPKGIRPARLGEETPVTGSLRTLPEPNEKIYAAVYKFRDLTGQYKLTETGSNFSTAVTQGATNILMKALEESNWFVPVERENVSNLLNERKIIRSSMAQFKNEDNSLPPLLFAGLIMEGGVVSYDANTVTGGAGLRYFGTGGSTQYRQDRVTVYLRAVATKTGKILKTIYTSKTILSQAVDGGVFRFVNFKRLLEAETGFTTTEPAHLAVTEAIEKAVHSMVLEGIRDSLWTSSPRSTARTKNMLNAYEEERSEMVQTDVYGAREQMAVPRIIVQPYGSAWRYQGDYSSPLNKIGYGASLEVYLTPYLAIQANASTGTLATKRFLSIDVNEFTGNILFRALPNQRFTPLFYAGAGYTIRKLGIMLEPANQRYFTLSGGGGLEYRLSGTLGLRGTLEYHQPFTDVLDGLAAGTRNDYYVRANAGLVLVLGHFGRP
ncbi:curli production assembly protein CsgG [Spirosoma aureum]|uniref:Curli production assembly protein CsgG n=1 Tax=Spirosoma aureum TaxID=2692134 RepID=A0A6G9AGN5_9BACT|nr:CsgG/HfaB family protein [Spirosoma aureum]QIP11637.1 curli production assembly protein CsgG [Spirosoma aureum]